MHEINKLRQRLSNVSKHATEYRMTVLEARELLAEIDGLLVPSVMVASEVPAPIDPGDPRILDCGGF